MFSIISSPQTKYVILNVLKKGYFLEKMSLNSVVCHVSNIPLFTAEHCQHVCEYNGSSDNERGKEACLSDNQITSRIQNKPRNMYILGENICLGKVSKSWRITLEHKQNFLVIII